MFKHADPSRRTPTYLQANTKENVVWQLKLLPVLLLGIFARDWWEDRHYRRARKIARIHNVH